MSEETKVEQTEAERPTITLGNVQYFGDNLSEEAIGILNDVKIVDVKLKDYETSFNIARFAKDALIARLDVSTFEKVPGQEETTETEAPVA